MIKPAHLLFFVYFFLLVNGLWAQESELKIYYTSSFNGNLEGCDCKAVPKAGLIKAGHFLSQIDRSHSLLIDAGDFSNAKNDALLSAYMLKAFQILKYDILVPGDQDWMNSQILPDSEDKSLPFLLNNFQEKGWRPGIHSKEPFYFEKSKVKIGISAVLEQKVFWVDKDLLIKLKEEYTVLNAAQTARDMLKQMKKENCQIKILIYHGYNNAAKKLLEEVPGFDIMILAHEQMLIEGEKINNTFLVSPGDNGNRVGELSIKMKNTAIKNINNQFHYFTYQKSKDDPRLSKLNLEYKREKIQEIKKRRQSR